MYQYIRAHVRRSFLRYYRFLLSTVHYALCVRKLMLSSLIIANL